MYNSYAEMKDAHQKMVNDFPIMFAFNNKQFAEGMEKFGLTESDTDKILSIGGGGFIRKSDREAFHDLFNKIHEEEKAFRAARKNLVKSLEYELANHEYCITGDPEEAVEAVGLTMEEVKANPELKKALKKAIENYLKSNE